MLMLNFLIFVLSPILGNVKSALLRHLVHELKKLEKHLRSLQHHAHALSHINPSPANLWSSNSTTSLILPVGVLKDSKQPARSEGRRLQRNKYLSSTWSPTDSANSPGKKILHADAEAIGKPPISKQTRHFLGDHE